MTDKDRPLPSGDGSEARRDCGHTCCDERSDPFHDHFLSPADCPSCKESSGDAAGDGSKACRCAYNDSVHHEHPDDFTMTCCVCGEPWMCATWIGDLGAALLPAKGTP